MSEESMADSTEDENLHFSFRKYDSIWPSHDSSPIGHNIRVKVHPPGTTTMSSDNYNSRTRLNTFLEFSQRAEYFSNKYIMKTDQCMNIHHLYLESDRKKNFFFTDQYKVRATNTFSCFFGSPCMIPRAAACAPVAPRPAIASISTITQNVLNRRLKHEKFSKYFERMKQTNSPPTGLHPITHIQHRAQSRLMIINVYWQKLSPVRACRHEQEEHWQPDQGETSLWQETCRFSGWLALDLWQVKMQHWLPWRHLCLRHHSRV